MPHIDLLTDEQTVYHLRQTLNDLIEKLTTSDDFNTPKPDELEFAGNASCMPSFDDSDLDEYGNDDVDYSQVTHGGMPLIYSTMETMDLFKWNSPPSEMITARSDQSHSIIKTSMMMSTTMKRLENERNLLDTHEIQYIMERNDFLFFLE